MTAPGRPVKRVYDRRERAALGAEEVARELVRQADALFDWASDVSHAGPHHAGTPCAAAETLELWARELRVLDAAM